MKCFLFPASTGGEQNQFRPSFPLVTRNLWNRLGFESSTWSKLKGKRNPFVPLAASESPAFTTNKGALINLDEKRKCSCRLKRLVLKSWTVMVELPLRRNLLATCYLKQMLNYSSRASQDLAKVKSLQRPYLSLLRATIVQLVRGRLRCTEDLLVSAYFLSHVQRLGYCIPPKLIVVLAPNFNIS